MAFKEMAETHPWNQAAGQLRRAETRDLRSLDDRYYSALAVAAAADPQAFARLYDQFFDPIHNYCVRRLGNREDAADATSHVFSNALHGLQHSRFDPTKSGSTIRGWLFAIAHNVIVDMYRHSRPTASIDAPQIVGGETASLQIMDERPGPEEQAVATDTGDRLSNALTNIPKRQRAVLELRLAGLSQSEIASVLGISTLAVRSAQFRGIGRLRTHLEPATHPTTDTQETPDE